MSCPSNSGPNAFRIGSAKRRGLHPIGWWSICITKLLEPGEREPQIWRVRKLVLHQRRQGGVGLGGLVVGLVWCRCGPKGAGGDPSRGWTRHGRVLVFARNHGGTEHRRRRGSSSAGYGDIITIY